MGSVSLVMPPGALGLELMGSGLLAQKRPEAEGGRQTQPWLKGLGASAESWVSVRAYFWAYHLLLSLRGDTG